MSWADLAAAADPAGTAAVGFEPVDVDHPFTSSTPRTATGGGVGSGDLVAGAKAGRRPRDGHDLPALRTLGATGSPLPAAAAEFYREVAEVFSSTRSMAGPT